MTTIAYRDGVLAADSLISSGSLRAGYCNKVFCSSDGWIGAICGGLDHLALFKEWMEGGRSKDFKIQGADAILISPDGTPYFWSGAGDPVEVITPFVAAGSGEKIAIGSMAFGASASEALKIAIEYDTGSGGPVVIQKVKRKKGRAA